MNDLVKASSLAMPEGELMQVLQNSIYPGAQPSSIKLVLNYCVAGGYDPLLKVVHIVPMSVKTGRKDSKGYDEYEQRDVLMPGIGLYRIIAARTGSNAGTSAPVFGPTQRIAYKLADWVDGPNGKRIKQYKDAELTYPEWCEVTVRRIVLGQIVEHVAREYWVENYATTGKDSASPNAMWKKRPFGQIAKCAEAQALRRGFPEVGSAPTMEEMLGKTTLDDEFVIDHETGVLAPRVEGPKAKSEEKSPVIEPEAQRPPDTPTSTNSGDTPTNGNGTEKTISPGGARIVKAKIKGYASIKSLSEEDATSAALAHVKASSVDTLTAAQANLLTDWLMEQSEC